MTCWWLQQDVGDKEVKGASKKWRNEVHWRLLSVLTAQWITSRTRRDHWINFVTQKLNCCYFATKDNPRVYTGEHIFNASECYCWITCSCCSEQECSTLLHSLFGGNICTYLRNKKVFAYFSILFLLHTFWTCRWIKYKSTRQFEEILLCHSTVADKGQEMKNSRAIWSLNKFK